MVKHTAPFLAVAGVMAVIPFLNAQEVRATLGGRVTDSQGAMVPNATVTVISQETNVEQHARTNPQGNWTMQFLLPGTYTFTISAQGFKTARSGQIELQASDIKQIDTRLELGSTRDTVAVTAEVPLIDTTSATSGTVITQEQIEEIPSMTHISTLLATLSPGVIAQDQNNNVGHLWSYNAASQFTANGGRNNVYSNMFLLDGFPNIKSGGDIAFNPSPDTLAEFRVQTNAYDASIGRQAGSTINQLSKSGRKNFSGELYEFNQNSALNANLFQTNLIGGAVTPVHFNEYGGMFGGPVWLPKLYDGRKKTFFFVAFDDTRNINPLGTAPISMPTALERTGDFSQSFTTQTVNGQLQRYPIQIFDPRTVNAKGDRQLFPGNAIPKTRLNQISQNILGYVPVPNSVSDPTGNAVNNYVPPAVRTDEYPLLSIRADQNWNDNHRSFATIHWASLTESAGDNFGPGNIASGNSLTRVDKSLGLDHVWILNQNRILDLRFGITRYEEGSRDAGAGFDPTKLGFPADFASKLSVPSFPHITGIAGDFGTNQANSFTNTTYYSWLANLTHVHGNHTFRYGAEYWILQQAGGSVGAQPDFDFNNSNWTRPNNNNAGGTGQGSSFASFLLGLPNGGSVPMNAQSFYSQHYMGFYFQDDWRVTSKLTLNLGLRWDFERPVQERYDRLTDRFDPTSINPISGPAQAAYSAILANPANASNSGVQLLKQLAPAANFQVPGTQLFAGVNGTPRTPVNADYGQWQPRIGFAYRLTPNTVLRGGVGRFSQASYITGGQNGFSRTTSLIPTQDNYLTPYDTLSDPFRGGVLQPTGSSLGPLTNLGSGPNWDDPNLGRFNSWEYSIHLQHQAGRWLFEVGYSHNKTYDIAWGWNQNLPSLQLWQQLQAPQFDASGRPIDTLPWNVQVPNPFYQLPGVTGGSIGSSKTVALNQLLNPIPLLGGVTKNRPTGSNQYDAGLGKIEHRFANHFSVLASFTWSKLFEDSSFLGDQITGARIEHKLGGEDRPLHFSIAPIYDLPFGHGRKFGSSISRWADLLIGGWQLVGTYSIQSGIPVVFGTNSFFTGNDVALPHDKQSLNEWFDTSQFAAFPSKTTNISNYPAWTGVQNLPGANYKPASGDSIKNGVYQDFANYVRYYPTRWSDVRASRVNSADIGVRKNLTLTEHTHLQLRIDAFNVFNHPRFGGPNTDPGSANFGRVTPAQLNQSRSIELAGKLFF
jgi:hypothetical protein